MMKKRFFLLVLSAWAGMTAVMAQPRGKSAEPSTGPDPSRSVENMEVSINAMDPGKRQRITEIMEEMQSRGLAANMLSAATSGGLTTMVDIVATEAIKLTHIRKTQKSQWMKMIEKECTYSDSISSVRGLQDFYTEPSRHGALDPSNINFDGISIRGVRDGREIVYLSCHIDTTRMNELFHHSKFYLVLDTLSFNPFECHLPNLGANNIRGNKTDVSGRENGFSFDERKDLTVGMELSLSSSWINEAVMIQQNVPLGTFKLNVKIPEIQKGEIFTYSRARIDRNRERMRKDRSLQLDTAYVQVQGDCFVVPRSFMPVSATERMWGTGEYKIKVKFRESCRFSQDAQQNDKWKHWHKDYRQLRKMQRNENQIAEYFQTLWNQNGDMLTKTMIKQGLSTGVSATKQQKK